MNQRTFLFLAILLSSIIHLQSSCVKNHPDPKPKELPPITTEGRNTIGFLLNGEVWLPGGGGIGSPDKEFVLDTFSNVLMLLAYYRNTKEGVSIQSLSLLINWPEHRCYTSDSLNLFKNSDRIIFSDYNLDGVCIDFIEVHGFLIKILHCNLSDQIISGTFELTIENECGDIYEITEGRFDARFRYF
jgi:hypothetical protein